MAKAWAPEEKHVANIFQQYLVPPKSVMDYSADLDQADMRRNALQQSALAVQQAQANLANAADVGSQRNALRAAVTAGQVDLSNPNHAARALAIAPDVAPGMLKTVQDAATARAQAGKAVADTAKTMQDTDTSAYDLRIKKSDQAIKDIAGFATPQDALASLQAHVAAGDVDPAKAQLIQQSMPQDPAKFSDWKIGMIRNIMSAKEQMQYSTPDANTVATNARVAAEGAANRANQVKVQQMITDRQDASGDDGSGLSDATKKRIATQAVDAGDYSGLKNVGRGKQGAADLRGIQNAITDYAASKGLSPTEISAKLAEFEGMKAGMRTSANISARVENAGAEADQLAPLAIDAGRKVARSGFLPFGRAQVLFNNQTNDPDMNRFATANMGLATAYAGAMARGGKATQTDMQHARDLLSTAKDQQAYEAIVNQMQQEIAAARRAPRQVRDNLSADISGKGGHSAAPVAANPGSGLPAGWSVEVH
jgi:hypothetical protein